jgi:Family of unknown function (DUF6069)
MTTTEALFTEAALNETALNKTAAPITIWKPGVVAGLVAAAATTLVAAVASAADVPLEIAGEKIPLMGFTQFTFVGALLGIALAKLFVRRVANPHRTFLRTTIVLTALSLVPDLAIDATPATKAVLALTHLVAASIIVPAIARQLRQ